MHIVIYRATAKRKVRLKLKSITNKKKHSKLKAKQDSKLNTLPFMYQGNNSIKFCETKLNQ